MKTHILIPFSTIEKMVNEFDEERKNSRDFKDFFKGKMAGLCDLLAYGIRSDRQISLSEKDAEEKARKNAPIDTPENPAYPNHSDTDIFIAGYKQALKDLQ